MTTLQEATDYAVLIYSSLMILTLIGLGIALLVIKSKVKQAKRKVEQKINILSNLPYIGKEVFRAVKKARS